MAESINELLLLLQGARKVEGDEVVVKRAQETC